MTGVSGLPWGPGASGPRRGGAKPLVKDGEFLQNLKVVAERMSWILTVCTGSALLARTGLLDGFRATSNKMAFEWVKTNGQSVQWQEKARWVVDGKYYTSSGVSAGIDMSLGFVCDHFGEEQAQKIAKIMEYIWNDDKDNDIFAV
jgi:transcriptional regulator GlxA family with amidase domain